MTEMNERKLSSEDHKAQILNVACSLSAAYILHPKEKRKNREIFKILHAYSAEAGSFPSQPSLQEGCHNDSPTIRSPG